MKPTDRIFQINTILIVLASALYVLIIRANLQPQIEISLFLVAFVSITTASILFGMKFIKKKEWGWLILSLLGANPIILKFNSWKMSPDQSFINITAPPFSLSYRLTNHCVSAEIFLPFGAIILLTIIFFTKRSFSNELSVNKPE